MKTLVVTSTSSAWVVGAHKRIQIPEGSVLVMDTGTNTVIGTLRKPPELNGTCIRISKEMYSVLAEDTTEEQAKKAKYNERLRACLDKITNEFDTLPVLDSGTPLQHYRDLGVLETWVDDPSILRSWLHHINLKIKHPSLTVEKAVFPDNSKHLILVLTQTW